MTKEIILGLITTFLAGVITAAWKSYILPFWTEHTGEKIRIYKSWTANIDFGGGDLHAVKLDLKKLGFKISGQLEFISGKHLGKKYSIRGRFQAHILTFHYYPHEKLSTSQGCATFQRLNDGEVLSGYFGYYSQSKNKIATVACNFTPVKN